MKKPRIMIVFGTRPEAIKMAPLVRLFKNDPFFETKVLLTAQHREMLDQVMDLFSIQGDYDLNLMKDKQTLESITTGVIQKTGKIFQEWKPDLVFVHGDTTTTFAASLAAFYQHIPIGHIEAGLRSDDLQNPFPEEMNRKLTDQITTLHFCPTLHAKENILKENCLQDHIYVTGNTVVDSLLWVTSQKNTEAVSTQQNNEKKTILMTMHRRESWGKPIENVSKAVRDITEKHQNIQIIFPIHKNPVVRESVYPYLLNLERVQLVEPMDYEQFVNAMKKAHIIVSDSGGVQEEAPTFGIPVLLTRKVTERPEGINCGVVKIVGTEYDSVFTELDALLTEESYYQSMSLPENPFGDGLASKRILGIVRNFFNLPPLEHPVKEFEK